MDAVLTPGQAMPLLDEFFQQHLPITRYLNMRAQAFDGETFSLAIDLQPSLNDKLTAFGGSLYCACVMNGWGMVYLQGRRRGINPNMVVRRGTIDYRAPVDDAVIVARCQTPPDLDWDAFYRDFSTRGRARCEVTSSIICGQREAVHFRGEYAIVGLAK